MHETSYRYTDASGERQSAHVRVSCPNGLSPADEFYLWGLLALAFAQREPVPDFYATPHYCLRELGIIQPSSKGGKSYRLFRESLGRLSGVRYENDRFFDPIRKEHRQVSFGLLGYSLPFDLHSSRAWRIVWDRQFFEFCQATGGHLRFDLALYRRLSPASRRLMLLLSKVFYRRRVSPRFGLRDLAVDVLGFSGKLTIGKLKQKILRAAGELREAGVVSGEPQFEQQAGNWRVRFVRGRRPVSAPPSVASSPLLDPLLKIGLELSDANRLVRRYKAEQIRIWSDVTLAAIELRGLQFFRRSPAAYLVDNLKAAADGIRTPPDWFVAAKKLEEQGPAPEVSNPDKRPKATLTQAIDPSVDRAELVRRMLTRAAKVK